ncbi:MAG TPA: FliH/SctL family protein [Acidobacteriota bacterium]|nr:FliH/SctL family protein [Acidobacteriota bacterium]
MATKIIKKGTERASMVQPFAFSENGSAGTQLMEPPEWADLQSSPVVASGNGSRGRDAGSPAAEPGALEKAAYERGLLQGEKNANEVAERKLEIAMKRYGDSIGEIRKLRSSLYAQVEREVVKLALAVAKKIVHREIGVDREIVQTLVHVALCHVAEKSAVTICLHPEDYGYLMERREELAQSEGREISLLADKSIERGGCLIQTNCGDIDARVEEEFREVERSFFEGVN